MHMDLGFEAIDAGNRVASSALDDDVARVFHEVLQVVAPVQIVETFRRLMPSRNAAEQLPDTDLIWAMLLATDLTIHEPEASGYSALHRLAERTLWDRSEPVSVALDLMVHSRLVVGYARRPRPGSPTEIVDSISETELQGTGPILASVANGPFAGRLAPQSDGLLVPVGPILCLQETWLGLGLGLDDDAMRPDRRGQHGPQSLAEALYREVIADAIDFGLPLATVIGGCGTARGTVDTLLYEMEEQEWSWSRPAGLAIP